LWQFFVEFLLLFFALLEALEELLVFFEVLLAFFEEL